MDGKSVCYSHVPVTISSTLCDFSFNPHLQLVKIHTFFSKLSRWINSGSAKLHLYKFTLLLSRKARFETIQPNSRVTEI